MGKKRYGESMEPVLRPVLGVDEVLLAVSPLVHDPGTTEDVPLTEDLKEFLNPMLYVGMAQPTGLAQRAFGQALIGSPDSVAGRLFQAISDMTGPKVAVTDRGVVIADVAFKHRGQGWFRRMFGAVDQVATLVHRVPREDIVGAVPAPRGVLRRGRLMVAFTDGSACALICAPPSLAEPVATAIGRPEPK